MAQRRQEHVPAVDIRPMVFECQRISTLMVLQHQAATSALDKKEWSLAWENRCRARAEQLSSVGDGSGGDGGLSGGGAIVRVLGEIELLVIKVLRLEEVDQGHSCILSILMVGGVAVLPMTMQRGGYVGGRIKDDWVIAVLDALVGLLWLPGGVAV